MKITTLLPAAMAFATAISFGNTIAARPSVGITLEPPIWATPPVPENPMRIAMESEYTDDDDGCDPNGDCPGIEEEIKKQKAKLRNKKAGSKQPTTTTNEGGQTNNDDCVRNHPTCGYEDGLGPYFPDE